MLLYDYQCDNCQTQFELRASFQEKERGVRPVCPNCQSTQAHQILTVGFFMHSSSGESGSSSSSCCSPNAGKGCCSG